MFAVEKRIRFFLNKQIFECIRITIQSGEVGQVRL